MLTKPNVLIVLLEYIDLFNPSDDMKQSDGRGCPALYHSILQYFILSMAILAQHILLKFAPIMPAFCSFAFAFLRIFLKIMPVKSVHLYTVPGINMKNNGIKFSHLKTFLM